MSIIYEALRRIESQNPRVSPETDNHDTQENKDIRKKDEAVTPERIISEITQQYGLTRERLLSKERSREVALPRQIAMYLMREETSTSLPKIGEILGGRDHTTVMYGHNKISGQLETDESMRRQLVAIRERLFQNGRPIPLSDHPIEIHSS